MIKLSYVIVTYNSCNDIVNCIESIYLTNDLPKNEVEIIVVDNSTKEVFDQMCRLIFTKFSYEISVIHNADNLGYGHGNNIGIKASKAPIVCVINPDVILQKCDVKKIFNVFNNHKKIAMVGGKQSGGINLSFWVRPELEFFIFTYILYRFLNWANIYIEKISYMSGAMLFLDRSRFLEINGFDEKIFLYAEEADITTRFINKGYSTKFLSDLKYLHLVDDRVEVSENGFKIQMKSIEYYLKKNNKSFASFVKRRIISYKILFLIGVLSGKNGLKSKSLKNLKFLEAL